LITLLVAGLAPTGFAQVKSGPPRGYALRTEPIQIGKVATTEIKGWFSRIESQTDTDRDPSWVTAGGVRCKFIRFAVRDFDHTSVSLDAIDKIAIGPHKSGYRILKGQKPTRDGSQQALVGGVEATVFASSLKMDDQFPTSAGMFVSLGQFTLMVSVDVDDPKLDASKRLRVCREELDKILSTWKWSQGKPSTVEGWADVAPPDCSQRPSYG